jgi:hypothetical protein
VKNRNPSEVAGKFEINSDTHEGITITFFNADGSKGNEVKMLKIK